MLKEDPKGGNKPTGRKAQGRIAVQIPTRVSDYDNMSIDDAAWFLKLLGQYLRVKLRFAEFLVHPSGEPFHDGETTGEHWSAREVEQLFHEASDLEGANFGEMLWLACGDREELRAVASKAFGMFSFTLAQVTKFGNIVSSEQAADAAS